MTKWGYFSDIILSPYIGFGIESDNKDFFKKQNDKFMHVCRRFCRHWFSSFQLSFPTQISQQVAEYNVRKYMQQLYTGVLYDGSKPAAITETLEEDVTPSRPPLSNVRVTFLPCDLQQTFAKAKYHEMFDVVYLGNMMAHRIVDAPQLLRRGGKLHAENAQ